MMLSMLRFLGCCLLTAQIFSSALFAGAAYVTNRNAAKVSVLDLNTEALTATPSVGSGPYQLAPTPNGSKVYVANSGSTFTSVIDTATNNVTSVTVAGTHKGLAITPDGSRVYVPCATVKKVSVIDTATDTVITNIDFGTRDPNNDPAITPDGSKAYVACLSTAEVGVIDIASNTISSFIPVFTTPEVIVITPDGSKAYVICNTSSILAVIDVATDTVIATISVGTQPTEVVFMPDGLRAFVANIFGDTVQVIDTTSDTIIQTISFPVGSRPYLANMSPDGSKVYVSLNGVGLVAVIDTTSYTYHTIVVGSAPFDVAFQPDGLKVYVTNRTSNTVSIIDTALETVDANVAVPTLPWFIAMVQVLPPSNLSGVQEKNIFLTQTDRINVITWGVPSGGVVPASYRIYRDAGLTQLIGTVEGSGKLEFADHNRMKNQSYTYYVVSVSANGEVSGVRSITITP